MKKKQITISEIECSNNVCMIIINNLRFHKNYINIIEDIISVYFKDEEVFFGFYRTDGINLSSEQQRILNETIPTFFQNNGEIQRLNDYLTVAKTKGKALYNGIIPSVFDYYLETMIFHPKVDWETFKHFHNRYLEHRIENIILSHFAELLLYYFDSGDIALFFDSQIYSKENIRRKITEILYNDTYDTDNQGTVL